MAGVLTVALASAVLPIQPATAQTKFSPDSARPPLLLKATPEERLRVAVQLAAQRVEHAIQRGDTVLLRALVPDAAIPDAEKPIASRAGCQSLSHALAKLKARPSQAQQSAALPLGRLHYENQLITARTDGDTVATFTARLMDRSVKGRATYAPLRFTLTRSGDALKLAQAPGVLAGLCGMAVAP
jgi:hypothetical protein